MNARFKNLVGSKRRSASNNPQPQPQGTSIAPQQRPTSLSPQPSNNSTNSLPPPQNTMNPNNPLGRPPSYTYAPPAGLAPGQQQQGRPNSPLPPINTGAAGYPPQHGQPMAYPPQGGPPGYPPQQQQPYGGAPPAQQQYGAPPPGQQVQQAGYRPGGMAEVAGEGRSKAQLIVGIDFVSSSTLFPLC